MFASHVCGGPRREGVELQCLDALPHWLLDLSVDCSGRTRRARSDIRIDPKAAAFVGSVRRVAKTSRSRRLASRPTAGRLAGDSADPTAAACRTCRAPQGFRLGAGGLSTDRGGIFLAGWALGTRTPWDALASRTLGMARESVRVDLWRMDRWGWVRPAGGACRRYTAAIAAGRRRAASAITSGLHLDSCFQ
jgi:hypothetical protein